MPKAAIRGNADCKLLLLLTPTSTQRAQREGTNHKTTPPELMVNSFEKNINRLISKTISIQVPPFHLKVQRQKKYG